MIRKLIILLVFVSVVISNIKAQETNEEVIIGVIQSVSGNIGTSNEILPLLPGHYFASEFATQYINMNPELLPNKTLRTITYDTSLIETKIVEQIISLKEQGASIIVGPTFDEESIIAATTAAALNITLISTKGATQTLNNREEYHTFNRMVPSNDKQAQVFIDLLHYYYEETGQKQWLEVAMISNSDSNGVSLASTIIDLAGEARPSIEILTYQSVISTVTNLKIANDVEQEIIELKNSESRVFIAILEPASFQIVVEEASKEDLFGDQYVWICADGCATSTVYKNLTDYPVFSDIETLRAPLSGLLGVTFVYPSGPVFDLYSQQFLAYFESIGLGSIQVEFYSPFTFDGIVTAAIAIDTCNKFGLEVNHVNLGAIIPQIEFFGTSGNVTFEPNGDRKAKYSIANYQYDINKFPQVGTWDEENGLVFDEGIDVLFHDRTSNIPDIDVREPFDYWSCPDYEKKTDETGKTIKLDTPGPSASNIASTYICDQYVDCFNMSDEFFCSMSITIAEIIFAFIIFFLILITFVFIIFTIIFGCIIKRKKVRATSPFYLILMCLAGIMSYISLFTFYGQDSIGSCPLRSWFLSISIFLLIGSLIIKSFRIWMLYRSTEVIRGIADWKLLILLILLLLPILFFNALWIILATPTASKKEKNGNDHWVCNTGGIINNDIAGYVFFSCIVAYSAIILFLGAIISFLTRNVASIFNESRLIAVSIYNLIFCGITIITVYFILLNEGPFWPNIILFSGVIYAVTTTLFLQFLPLMYQVIIKDKLKEKTKDINSTGASNTNSGSAGSQSQGAWFNE